MMNPIGLTGDMFGLQTAEGRLLRERLFECSFPMRVPHRWGGGLLSVALPVIGVYGGHVRIRSGPQRSQSRENWLGDRTHTQIASELMGIDWMNLAELSEAIPPAYTHHIATEFLRWRSLTS